MNYFLVLFMLIGLSTHVVVEFNEDDNPRIHHFANTFNAR